MEAHSHWLSDHPRPVREFILLVQKYRRPIIFSSIALVLICSVVGGLRYYQERKLLKAAKLYAMLPQDQDARLSAMVTIAETYPETGAGILARFALGRDSFEKKEYEKASHWFEALQDLPDDQAMIRILALHNLGAILEEQGQWEKAQYLYRKAAADPGNHSAVIATYHLGRTAEALGRLDEARKWYRQVADEGVGLSVADRAKERLLWLDISESS